MTRVTADFWPEQGATKAHTLGGSVREEQRRPGEKAAQPFGREQFGASGCVARSLQVAMNMRLTGALPSAQTCSRAGHPITSIVS